MEKIGSGFDSALIPVDYGQSTANCLAVSWIHPHWGAAGDNTCNTHIHAQADKASGSRQRERPVWS